MHKKNALHLSVDSVLNFRVYLRCNTGKRERGSRDPLSEKPKGKQMSTVHNPTQFDPTHYEVLDYLDNQPPRYLPGEPAELYREMVDQWRADMRRVFGEQYGAKIHRCIHCGNGNVRWITAVRHIPTGENFVFGSDCTARLNFPDRVSFKLALLKSRAEARTERFKIFTKREAYLQAHPEIADALAHVSEPQHAKNFFVHDVLAKLDKYGELSARQAECVVDSMRKDNERMAQRAAEDATPRGDAPTGRADVWGVVLSVKEKYTDFGITLKMLMKLDNGARVWCTVPSRYSIEVGDRLHLRATWEVSQDDKSFAFGSRPHLLKHEPKPKPEPTTPAQRDETAEDAAKMLASLASIDTLQAGEVACEEKGDYVAANIYRSALVIKRSMLAQEVMK